jgi:hypothetical protein
MTEIAEILSSDHFHPIRELVVELIQRDSYPYNDNTLGVISCDTTRAPVSMIPRKRPSDLKIGDLDITTHVICSDKVVYNHSNASPIIS